MLCYTVWNLSLFLSFLNQLCGCHHLPVLLHLCAAHLCHIPQRLLWVCTENHTKHTILYSPFFPLFHCFLLFHSSEPKILFSYKSQVDEPDESDVHLPPTVATTLGRKEMTDQGLYYSSTQIDGSGPSSSRMVGAYLDDVASGPYGSSSINSIEADRWRPVNAWSDDEENGRREMVIRLDLNVVRV